MSDLIKQVGGLQRAKDIVSSAHNHAYSNVYCLQDESFWDGSDLYCGNCINLDNLRQAIADYNTDHCVDISNHISPSTVRIEK